MNPKWLKMTAAAAAVAFVALGAYTFSLGLAKAALTDRLEHEKTRLEQFQRKYGECRKESESLLAVKTGLEGRQRVVQSETDAALNALKAENARLQTGIKAGERNVAAMTAERDRLNKNLAEMQEAGKKATKELKACSDTNDVLERTKKSTDDKLKRAESELNRARTRNGELCSIALELVQRYKNKGILGAVADKEPLTQINKAKLEEAVQEYKDKIEAQRMSPSGK